MRSYLLLCALVISRACANENDDDDLQQVQQLTKSVKGGLPGGFQYNPGANLVSLFGNRTQQSTQQSWNQDQESHSQDSWSQRQNNQASWQQNQQGRSWNQVQGQSQGWNQQNQGWNQAQGQGQTGWNQAQGQAQTGWNQAQGATNGTAVGRNTSRPLDLEVGVCYIEVPTARLAKDPDHVPQGNGSRPDLSIIRTCCNGYIRNIHNFRRCDPVCSQECVNALCTAPETCTCFPDHVKNLAGFCIPTCPIGCQNGRCDGGECMCKEGFKLHQDSQFCVPECKGNCGGVGNCTEPNTCDCKPGFQTTPEGSCKPHCDKCTNGDCIQPNVCQCHQGYTKDKDGICASQCGPGYEVTPQGCKPVCDKCTDGDCLGPNNCQCRQGYAKENGLCVPHCSPACSPAERCISPNVCVWSGPPSSGQVYPNLPQPNPDSLHVDPNAPAPQCSQPCLNGVCVQGNQCQCNPGFVMDKNDATLTRCIPNCPGGCPNGVCSAPNFCICNQGYVKDHSVKGHPTCVKRVRRSADPNSDANRPINVAELLIFEIPDQNSVV